jgi:hypothetical protein
MGPAVSNATAFANMQKAIDTMAKIGRLPQDVAAAAAPLLEKQLLANIAAQRGPDGKAWQPSANGAPVLLNAGKSLKVGSTGPTLWARLYGVEARHHLGAVKGGVRRRILPRRDSMKGVSKILQQVARQKWEAATNG